MAIDPQLQEVLFGLKFCQTQVADSMIKGTRRAWTDYQTVKAVGKFDLAGQHKLFDRSASNDSYGVALKDSDKKLRDVLTIKLSADLLAGMERDYRMRQRSRIRMFAHSTSRTYNHGLPTGAVDMSSMIFLGNILGEEARNA